MRKERLPVASLCVLSSQCWQSAAKAGNKVNITSPWLLLFILGKLVPWAMERNRSFLGFVCLLCCCLFKVWLFVILKYFFLTGLRLRSRSPQQGQPTSLGNPFLALFFGFLHCLGQQFSVFCSLLLVFLSVLFLQSSTSAFVSQAMWSNKALNLGRFRPGLLPFFV